MADFLIHEHFQQALDKPFILSGDDQQLTLTLTLIEVKRLRGPQREEDKRDQFSLLFRGPSDPLIAQHQYTLHNNIMGELTLFLVPVGRVDQCHQDPQADVLYEAVFT